MKRQSAVIGIVMLCLILAWPAAASMVAGSGANAAYIGQHGYPTALTDAAPLAEQAASAMVYAGEALWLYEVTDGEGTTLMRLAAGGEPEALAEVLSPSVYIENDAAVYYVAADAPDRLMALAPPDGEAAEVARVDAGITGLRPSIDGLLVAEGDQERLYSPLFRQFRDALADASGLTLGGDLTLETALSEEGSLTVRKANATTRTPVADNVLTACAANGYVYYLQAMGEGARLMNYDVETGESVRIEFFSDPVMPALAVTSERAYVIGADSNVLAVPLSGTQEAQSLGAPDDMADGRLIATDGQLLVYDMVDGQWQFVTAYPIDEAVAGAYTELKRGDRGDDVKRVQEALREYKYLKGSADGIYGSDTEHAVRYLQCDLSLTETGRADAQLQKTLFEGDPPTYHAYVTLRRGDKNIRVSDMQARLRALYYTLDRADGAYGSSTAEAVRRFHAQIGHKENGDVITASELEQLFKSSAKECTQYFKLEHGDEGPAVERLNKRLKKLNYLEGSAGDEYTSRTVQAIRDFQAQIGHKVSGVADAATQRKLFSKSAPDPEPTPEPGPNKQVVSSSVTKTLRTWLKNNMDLDYNKAQAVTYLQNELISRGYLSAGLNNGVYNLETQRAVAAFQKANGLKSSGSVNKNTLKALFLAQ